MINKYFAVFKISWEQGLVYRLNFALWRVRTVLQLLLVYFIWWTVFQTQNEVFGYTSASILTYILVSAVIRAIVLSSRAMDVANQINDGSVVNFLIKPLGFIQYYLSRDLADKLLNISFVIFEIGLIIFLLRPEIIIQTQLSTLLLFILAVVLGIIVYFCIGFIISLLSFWVENSWGPMFLIFIFLEGFGGALFPVDILPKGVFNFLMLTPFPYLIYFPSKLYLGGFSANQLVLYFSILSFWVIGLWFIMRWVVSAGLRHYTAVGH